MNNEPDVPEPVTVSVAEAARLLGVSEVLIRSKAPVQRLGRRILVPMAWIHAFGKVPEPRPVRREYVPQPTARLNRRATQPPRPALSQRNHDGEIHDFAPPEYRNRHPLPDTPYGVERAIIVPGDRRDGSRLKPWDMPPMVDKPPGKRR